MHLKGMQLKTMSIRNTYKVRNVFAELAVRIETKDVSVWNAYEYEF